ncbi:MAG TPA: hypothetical protein VKR56_14150 [Candidatus Cybelea sp.]|nr:hypothetical protein [Candidatus Cybelea sp.]
MSTTPGTSAAATAAATTAATPIKWFALPQKHDYPAAQSYLSLTMKPDVVKKIVAALKKAEMTAFKSKDIFRASLLSLLGVSNYHVEKVRAEMLAGQAISPLLLFREKTTGRVIIADGYHRLCAVYTFDEDAVIPCKIV